MTPPRRPPVKSESKPLMSEQLTMGEFTKRVQDLARFNRELLDLVRFMDPAKRRKFSKANTAVNQDHGSNIPAWAHMTLAAGYAEQVSQMLINASNEVPPKAVTVKIPKQKKAPDGK